MKTLLTIDDLGIRPKPDFRNFRKALLRDGRPDYVPFYELLVKRVIMERVLGRRIAVAADEVEFFMRAGYDYAPVGVYIPLKTGSMDDDGQGHPITCREDFERYEWPEPSCLDFSYIEAAASSLPDGMKIVGQSNGIFENVECLCGYQNLCLLLMDDRELVKEIFKKVGAYFTALYGYLADMDAVGALAISDDMGYRTQTLISPDDLRELVLPWHMSFAKIAHDHDKPCILHSCGNLVSIMDDIIDYVKVDAKHSYEDAIIPVAEAKRRYGSRISILGGFDLDRLCRSSQEEIAAHTEKLISECGPEGYAIGSGNSIADYVPVENYLRMLKTAWDIRMAS